MTDPSSQQIISQLDQARNLAKTNHETYPQVVKQILQFIPNPNKDIEKWCINFLHESFVNNSIISHANMIDLAIDSLDGLIYLSNIKDIELFKLVIDISIVVYKLVFVYVNENDNSNVIWSKLIELKNSLVNKFQSNFPLDKSDNEEHDLIRNIDTKVELLKFIIIVIDYQSKTTIINDNGDLVPSFNLNMINPNHSLIKVANMEYESNTLLDLILKTFNHDILIPQLFSSTLFNCIIIMKKKPQYVDKILKILQDYNTQDKLQSNYQSQDQYKLAKKYIDRSLKIFINFCLRNGLIPSNYQSVFEAKVKTLIERGNEVRKKNLFAIPEPNLKKRKFEGFYNPVKKIKVVDYKNLYCLNEVSNKLNDFDLQTVPQNILSLMVINALQKVSVNKLSKALEIISERYLNVIKTTPDLDLNPTNNSNNSLNFNQNFKQEVDSWKQEKDTNDDDEEDEGDYNPESVYTLEPAKDLSFKDKKNHIQIIIKNFFKIASNPNINQDSVPNDSKINRELSKIAIEYWKKDSWLVLLTRLATRGMRMDEDSLTKQNENFNDMIRNAILEYFLDDIHQRIDAIIEWLNEEWYSEQVYNEENPDKKTDLVVYTKWTGKVLDAMIPFLEPNDRKIFIRLISDLPYLNEDLVSRIKSLCIDPARSKIGFLSLQFLIMYRPPVKQVTLNILKELSESDQEDLQQEAKKLLLKYDTK